MALNPGDPYGEGEETPGSPTIRMSSRSYCVYILASRSRVLYTGVTNDLERRLAQHRPHNLPKRAPTQASL